MNLYLNDLAKRAHEAAVSKGFWAKKRDIGETHMLIVSELSEALEAHRKGKFASVEQYKRAVLELMPKDSDCGGLYDTPCGFDKEFEKYIKDSFEDELCDAVIRILDYIGSNDYFFIDISRFVHKIEGEYDDLNIGDALIRVTGKVYGSYVYMSSMKYMEGDFLNLALAMIFDIAKILDIDLVWHIEEKLKYNHTRLPLHGKLY